MSVAPHTTALMVYLKTRSDIYHGKILELREAVERWLAYVPQTFPHYTRHTVQHSDEIVVQASKLLFRDGDPARPAIALSPVEAYVLIAAAYLHDTGMVSADIEKLEILKSSGWNEWISAGIGAKRWREIQALRQGTQPSDAVERNFVADVQTRFLLAEFIRRIHHFRAADVIRQHQVPLGRFALDDLVLQRTISDVCVAHGLRQHELEDEERYPYRRDIRGEPTNVRLIAILLRLADLLDMSNDRACPLLLNAACPLPADSLAHWTQYQRITHRLTAPDEIAITAECHNQEEHRVLQDWCQWIVDEVRNARLVMTRTTRHQEWQPPRCGFDPPDATIKIRPDATATYIPSKWAFELDADAVFERLVHDVYEQPLSFIRELIQNALDANRCQMYADMQREGVDVPQYPTRVDEARRSRYPVRVALETREVENSLSGERERRQVLIVDDCGLGMDSDIIQRYFLQVGRSYYTTEEFRRNYGFVPASRFGVGFLSVFAVSDRVTVDTYKRASPIGSGAIHLTLTGPRNYLLTEKSTRHVPGTRIEVLLRESIELGVLARLVSLWCRRVEVPVIVDDLGVVTTVVAERPEQFVYELADVTKEGAKFVVRSFPVNRPGIEGECYVFSRVDENGESWAAWNWARYRYPGEHPEASAPPFVGSLTCIHGISIAGPGDYASGPMSMRVDYRGESYVPVLARGGRRSHSLQRHEMDPVLASRWEEILAEHLRTSPRALDNNAWIYKQRLVTLFPFPSFWESIPGTIRMYEKGLAKCVALCDVGRLPILTAILSDYDVERWDLKERDEEIARAEATGAAWRGETLALLSVDISRLSDEHRKAIFQGRGVGSVRWLPEGHLAIDWILREGGDVLFAGSEGRPILLAELPDDGVVGCPIHKTTDSTYECTLLNVHSPFVEWLRRVKDACVEGHYGLTESHFGRLMSVMNDPLRFGGLDLPKLTNYLDRWREIKGLPPDLHPPHMQFDRSVFFLRRRR